MKRYKIYYLLMFFALAFGVASGFMAEWVTMIWSLCAGGWVWLATVYLKQRDDIERQFREYVNKHREVE